LNFIFIYQFSHSAHHPSVTGDLSLVRYLCDVFHVLLGLTFVFGLRAKKPKNLKPFKNWPRFFQPWWQDGIKTSDIFKINWFGKQIHSDHKSDNSS